MKKKTATAHVTFIMECKYVVRSLIIGAVLFNKDVDDLGTINLKPPL